MCNSQISLNVSRLEDKCDRFLNNSKWYKYSREDSVVNLSNFNLTSHMKCILGYGLSFSLPSTGNSIIKFLTDFSFFENNMQKNLSTLKGYILNSAISSYNKFCLPKSFMTALRQLKSNKELVVTKADKGNKVVIMNVNDYKTKLYILLSDNDTYEPCVRDPLKSWQQNNNRSLKSIFADFPNLNKKKISILSSVSSVYVWFAEIT